MNLALATFLQMRSDTFEALAQWVEQNGGRRPTRRKARSAEAMAEDRASKVVYRLELKVEQGSLSPELKPRADDVCGATA